MRQGAKSKQMCVLKAMFEMFYGWAAIKYATKGSFRPFFAPAAPKKGPKKRRGEFRRLRATTRDAVPRPCKVFKNLDKTS